MALTIRTQEDAEMAGQGTTAEMRVFRTTDGKLVNEHDPRGAFLAYAPGDGVPAHHVEQYNALKARHDKGAPTEDALMVQQVDGKPAGPAGEFVQIHDDLATALADEAQRLANAPVEERVERAKDRADDGVRVADRRLLRTEDGDLVNDSDARGLTLAYIAGDTIKAADVDAYDELNGDQDNDEDAAKESDEDNPQEGGGNDPKMVKPPANKAATTRTSKTA